MNIANFCGKLLRHRRVAFSPHLLYSLILALTACDKSALPPSGQLEVAAVGIHSGVINDQGTHVIVGSIYHGISFWRLSDGERLFDWNHKSGADTTMIAADFSAAGDWALTADIHTLVLWNTTSGDAPRFWRAPSDILAVQLSSGGHYALLGLNDHTAVVFDVLKGGIVRTLNHNNRVRSVGLSDDSKIAVSGSEDYTATTWDLDSGKALAKFQHNDEVQLVKISGDGSLVLSVSKYDKAVIWRSETGEMVGEIPLSASRLKRGVRFTAARFSSDNQFLITGQMDQTITLWRVADLTRLATWKATKRKLWKPGGAAIVDVAFTDRPDRFSALASNGFLFELLLEAQ